jgi:hypothetical protein
MTKAKKDLVSKKKPIEVKKTENKKGGKVQDLAPKAKNLPSNIKEKSEGMKKGKKMGDTSYAPISPSLKKSKKK